MKSVGRPTQGTINIHIHTNVDVNVNFNINTRELETLSQDPINMKCFVPERSRLLLRETSCRIDPYTSNYK